MLRVATLCLADNKGLNGWQPRLEMPHTRTSKADYTSGANLSPADCLANKLN